MLLAREMRPLPAASCLMNPEVHRIAEAPLSLVRGPAGSYVAESLAASLASACLHRWTDDPEAILSTCCTCPAPLSSMRWKRASPPDTGTPVSPPARSVSRSCGRGSSRSRTSGDGSAQFRPGPSSACSLAASVADVHRPHKIGLCDLLPQRSRPPRPIRDSWKSGCWALSSCAWTVGPSRGGLVSAARASSLG